jgi:hypothetical protein
MRPGVHAEQKTRNAEDHAGTTGLFRIPRLFVHGGLQIAAAGVVHGGADHLAPTGGEGKLPVQMGPSEGGEREFS